MLSNLHLPQLRRLRVVHHGAAVCYAAIRSPVCETGCSVCVPVRSHTMSCESHEQCFVPTGMGI